MTLMGSEVLLAALNHEKSPELAVHVANSGRCCPARTLFEPVVLTRLALVSRLAPTHNLVR